MSNHSNALLSEMLAAFHSFPINSQAVPPNIFELLEKQTDAIPSMAQPKSFEILVKGCQKHLFSKRKKVEVFLVSLFSESVKLCRYLDGKCSDV
jgi:hypothetical protein